MHKKCTEVLQKATGERHIFRVDSSLVFSMNLFCSSSNKTPLNEKEQSLAGPGGAAGMV